MELISAHQSKQLERIISIMTVGYLEITLECRHYHVPYYTFFNKPNSMFFMTQATIPFVFNKQNQIRALELLKPIASIDSSHEEIGEILCSLSSNYDGPYLKDEQGIVPTNFSILDPKHKEAPVESFQRAFLEFNQKTVLPFPYTNHEPF